jgi:hypothetical protein
MSDMYTVMRSQIQLASTVMASVLGRMGSTASGGLLMPNQGHGLSTSQAMARSASM